MPILAVPLLLVGCVGGTRPAAETARCMETQPPSGPGRVAITPPRDVREQALARGQPLLVVQARVCVGPDGSVHQAVVIDSSGIDCFDEHVTAALKRSTLRFLIRAKDGCGTMTVQWNASSAP